MEVVKIEGEVIFIGHYDAIGTWAASSTRKFSLLVVFKGRDLSY